MKKGLIYIVFSALSASAMALPGQGDPARALQYFKNAEKQYSNQRYAYAIPLYHTSLAFKGKTDSLAILHLAESYWQTKNYDSSLRFYLAFEKRYGAQTTTTQRIAELQATMGNYAAAAELYQKILRSDHGPGAQAELFKKRIKGFSATTVFLRDSLDAKVELLKLNSTQQDFSPQYYQNGLVFVSNRFSKKTERGFGWDDLPYSQIYRVRDIGSLEVVDSAGTYHYIPRKSTVSQNHDYTQETSNDNNIIVLNSRRTETSGEVSNLEKFSNGLDARFNYGPLCFNHAGTKVYFTRNTMQAVNGRFNLEICEAVLHNGSWSNIKVMPFVEAGYDYFHPALNSDETRLYFCSNKPGGEGGSDIYYISFGNDMATKTVMPIDYKINTAGNELFPTIKGDTLYFSSDGHPGLGGLDIFSSTAINYRWSEPKNLGYPFNSAFDDFGIIFDSSGSKGFMTSNRLGSDDIFRFESHTYYLELNTLVVNKLTGEKLGQSKVRLRSDEDGKIMDSAITDSNGPIRFPVRPGSTYTILAERKDFYPDSLHISNTGKEGRLQLDPVKLLPVPKVVDTDADGIPDDADKCPGIKGVQSAQGCPDIQNRLNELAKMVFFKTASAELTPEAIKPLTEAAEIIKDYPEVTIDIEGHTDNRASAPYNKDLSQRRANTVKNFFVKKGFAASRFTAVGYGLERPIATNATEEGRAMNRRVALKANFK